MKHPAIKIKKFLQGDFNNMGKMIDDCDMLSGGKVETFTSSINSTMLGKSINK